MNLYFNKSNRKRTIEKILEHLKTQGLLRRPISHKCSSKYCRPHNISNFLSLAQANHFSFDTLIYVCIYQQIHVCVNNSQCIYSYPDNKGGIFCPISGKTNYRLISDILIQNKNLDVSKKLASVPQDELVSDRHSSRKKMHNFSYSLDKYYNDLFYPELLQEENEFCGGVLNNTIDTKFIKKREKKIPRRELKRGDQIPSNKELLDILSLVKPMCGFNFIMNCKVYLRSYKLHMFIKHKLTSLDYLISTGKLRLTSIINDIIKRERVMGSQNLKKSKSFYTYLDVLTTAEGILRKILPGIYRIKQNYFLIETFQRKLYTCAISYIEKCMRDNVVVNEFHLLNMLNFDDEWGDRHVLDDWVSFDKWVYFMRIILRSYIFCENCGISRQKKKSLGPIKHVLGVMYTLQQGYTKKIRMNNGYTNNGYINNMNDNGYTNMNMNDMNNGYTNNNGCTNYTNNICCFELIPQDMYLRKYGVLLEKSKLSTYIGKNARKWITEGVKIFHEFLNFGFKVMTDVELRNIIFP